jgi:methyl-accepting chemotaxis protein WspA
MCHGDPKNSVAFWDNDKGEDFSGATMEGWKTGQIVGVFEVQQSLKPFQEVAKASLRENLIVAVSILLVGFLGIGYFMNTFNRFISTIGVKVNSLVQEILATTQDQEASARETVATTTEIGATAMEISTTSRELVKTMSEVTEVAQQTAQFADNGQADLKRIEETMGRFTEAVKSINTKLALINDKSSNINQVITTITKVADQTNLLSLNAAIEAEKAGEYGRGFAVVATEIRRLADQTAVASNDIEGIVKEMQSAVSSGVMGIEQFAEEVRRGTDEIKQIGYQLSEMLLQVRELFPRFERVNDGMRAQSTGAEQISEALVQLSDASRNVLESLQRSKVSSQQLDQVWDKLRDGISRFTGKSGKQA